MSLIKRLFKGRVRGGSPQTGRWFYQALIEANYGAGRLAYGW